MNRPHSELNDGHHGWTSVPEPFTFVKKYSQVRWPWPTHGLHRPDLGRSRNNLQNAAGKISGDTALRARVQFRGAGQDQMSTDGL